MFIRKDWIDQTVFYPHSSQEVLKEVLTRTQSVLDQKKLPIIVFDLDSTLFHVSPRSYEILKEWAQSTSISILPNLSVDDMGYSIEDVWTKKGLSIESGESFKYLKEAKNFWRQRFFSNEYIHHDLPHEGAVEFVNTLYQMGAKIVYLTGRDVPLMAFGTVDHLRRCGFPVEVERTRLILKPKRHIDDLVFKTDVCQMVREWGEVVASFENEPKNLVAMQEALGPKTMHIFFESVSSDHAAPAAKEVYKIKDFQFKS
jgi:hypothetical protein